MRKKHPSKLCGISVGRIRNILAHVFIILVLISIYEGIMPGHYAWAGPGKKHIKISKREKYNVILVVVDSLRADHVSCYGYKKLTTPHIDKIAAESIIFKYAFSSSNYTLPSHASIFTSKHVPAHKVNKKDKKLRDAELTLAEILKIYGYNTAAYSSGKLLDEKYKLNQGFDVYHNIDMEISEKGNFKNTLPMALKWLKKNKDNRFFAFLQTNSVHAPYHAPYPYENMHDPDYKGVVDSLFLDTTILQKIKKNKIKRKNKEITLSQNDIDHIIAHYDGGISYADYHIGQLVAGLKNLDLFDKTIIIITSDHGEGLNTHTRKFLNYDKWGFIGFVHRNVYYDEALHVPLIIYHPDIPAKGLEIDNQVQHIDVMPTVLDFLGIPVNNEMQGLSLIPLI